MYFQKEKMEKAIETIQTNFNTVRTGRANHAVNLPCCMPPSENVCYKMIFA
jgi:hypothetical protein